MIFTAIFAAYALLVLATVAWIVRFVLTAPRRERRQVDALEAAWALDSDEAVRR